jgi:hypothetical protein
MVEIKPAKLTAAATAAVRLLSHPQKGPRGFSAIAVATMQAGGAIRTKVSTTSPTSQTTRVLDMQKSLATTISAGRSGREHRTQRVA